MRVSLGGRLSAAAVVMLLALAGCGSDGDGVSQKADASPKTGAAQKAAGDDEVSLKEQLDDDPAVYGGDRVQIRENLRDVQDSLLSEDGGMCFELTDGAERRLARWVKQPGAGCFTIAPAVAKRRRQLGVETVRSRVQAIKITGGYRYGDTRRASLTVRDPSGEPYEVRFLHEDGEWGLVRLWPGTPSGLGPPS